MNISVLIPTRGDRPQFLSNAHRMLSTQTMLPTHVELVDDKPNDPAKKDITWRYRIGCERILQKNPTTDAIVLIEDDDWYARTYLEVLALNWEVAGKPEVYGIGQTIYYHLGMRGWYSQNHPNRASAMSTLISAAGARRMVWPNDNFVFTDIELWKKLSGKTFFPSAPIAIGIKHGLGLCGGIGHRRDLAQYKHADQDFAWLRSRIDYESFDFYMSILPLIK